MKSKSLFGIIFLLLFISCKKLVAATIPTENTASISALVSCCSPHSIIDDMLFVNTYGNTSNARGNRFWVAATTINAVQEHRDFSVAFGFSAPPLGLNIYLTNWGVAEGIASTPLFGKRFIKDLPGSYINTYLVFRAVNSVPLVGYYISFFAAVTRARLDMAIDYHIADMTRFTSDFIKETEYHELSHASHYTQVGTGWYTQFVKLNPCHPCPRPNGFIRAGVPFRRACFYPNK